MLHFMARDRDTTFQLFILRIRRDIEGIHKGIYSSTIQSQGRSVWADTVLDISRPDLQPLGLSFIISAVICIYRIRRHIDLGFVWCRH